MRHLLGITLTAWLLSGCAAPAPRHSSALPSRSVERPVVLASSDTDVTGAQATLGSLDVDACVQLAINQNPEILAARNAIDAQSNVAPQVSSLSDPVLATTVQPFPNHSVQTAAGRGVNNLTIAQKLPWIDKLGVRAEVADQDTQIASARLAQAEQKLIEDVRLAYYELAFANAAISLIEEDKDLLEQLIEVADARYTVREASQQDVLRAEVALGRLDDQLIALARQRDVAQADLAKLMHLPPDQTIDVPGEVTALPVPTQIEALYDVAIQSRPELREQLHAIMKSERKRELARLNYYPDFNVGLGWQAIASSDSISPVANGNDNLAFMFGVTLPIWEEKLSAGLHEAEHRIMESNNRYEATRDDTLRLIRRAVVKAQSLEEQIRTYEDRIIPKVDQALEVSTADYRVNKIDFQQVLENWSDLLTFQLQVVRFKASLNQTLASLERVVGQDIIDRSPVSEEQQLPDQSEEPEEIELPMPDENEAVPDDDVASLAPGLPTFNLDRVAKPTWPRQPFREDHGFVRSIEER